MLPLKVVFNCGMELQLEDNVFIGPNVTFTNDLIPRSKQYPASFAKTIIKEGASIGANATIIAGNEIGTYAMVGAGCSGDQECWEKRIVGWEPRKTNRVCNQ